MDKSLKYHETRSKQWQACEHKFQPWKIIKTSVTVFCSSRGIAWRPFIIDERLERRLYRTVLVEIASVFAPSRYKFIRSLSATERSIRRSINVASPRGTRGRFEPSPLLPFPLLPFHAPLCSIFSTVSSALAYLIDTHESKLFRVLAQYCQGE